MYQRAHNEAMMDHKHFHEHAGCSAKLQKEQICCLG